MVDLPSQHQAAALVRLFYFHLVDRIKSVGIRFQGVEKGERTAVAITPSSADAASQLIGEVADRQPDRAV